MTSQLTEAFEDAVACIAPADVVGPVPECLPMTTAAMVTDECVAALSALEYSSYRCAPRPPPPQLLACCGRAPR